MKNGNNSQTRLQRGHFTLKSSALAPTAMSYMGQDLIANHMKSHYRRILSAKAAVDTSPPKSTKMHIKVRDQKKRAVLESRAGTPLSLRTRSPSMESLSSSHDETSAMNSTRSQQSPGQRLATGTPVQSPGRRTSTGTPIQRSLSMQSLNRHYPPAVPSPSPREMTARGKSTSTSCARPPLHPPVSPIAKESRQTLRTGHQLRHKKDLRTVHSLDKSEKTTPADNYLDNNVRTLLGTYDEPVDIKVPMTAGYSTVGERSQESDTMSHGLNNRSTSRSVRHDGVPRLDLTQVSYSHRGPPSIRSMNDSTDFNKASIWEEEQRYLKFISDVTTDILARGIFSNRVLQQVFEMHIEKRKDHLDESRLWEMIEQLKEDLGITDS